MFSNDRRHKYFSQTSNIMTPTKTRIQEHWVLALRAHKKVTMDVVVNLICNG